MFKITKEFGFEMAHMLEGHKGKCLNLHGHSYKLKVTIKSEGCDGDMLLDFSELKQIVKATVVDKLDHAFAYYINSSDAAEKEIAEILKKNGRQVVGFPFRPTAEKMAEYIYNLLKAPLSGQGYRLDNVVLYETATSFAQYGQA